MVFTLLEKALLFYPGIYRQAFGKFDIMDLVFGRSQVIGEPARFIVSADLESISLVYMSSQGNLQSADYQTDSPIYNIETVSLLCLFINKFSFPKYMKHKNLIIIPPTDGGETYHKAPDKVF